MWDDGPLGTYFLDGKNALQQWGSGVSSTGFRRPHTEERLPWNSVTSPGATPQPAGRSCIGYRGRVNSVRMDDVTDAKKRRAVEEARLKVAS
jgi:hypothetical protein